VVLVRDPPPSSLTAAASAVSVGGLGAVLGVAEDLLVGCASGGEIGARWCLVLVLVLVSGSELSGGFGSGNSVS
jgi:hypothetical protein